MRLRKRDGKGIEVKQEMKEGQGRRAGGSEEMRRWKGKRERESKRRKSRRKRRKWRKEMEEQKEEKWKMRRTEEAGRGEDCT